MLFCCKSMPLFVPGAQGVSMHPEDRPLWVWVLKVKMSLLHMFTQDSQHKLIFTACLCWPSVAYLIKKNMINVLLLLSFFFSDLATGEKSKNTSFSGNFLDLSKKMTLNRLSAKYESGKVVKREGLLIFISQRSHCIITFS